MTWTCARVGGTFRSPSTKTGVLVKAVITTASHIFLWFPQHSSQLKQSCTICSVNISSSTLITTDLRVTWSSGTYWLHRWPLSAPSWGRGLEVGDWHSHLSHTHTHASVLALPRTRTTFIHMDSVHIHAVRVCGHLYVRIQYKHPGTLVFFCVCRHQVVENLPSATHRASLECDTAAKVPPPHRSRQRATGSTERQITQWPPQDVCPRARQGQAILAHQHPEMQANPGRPRTHTPYN